MCWSFRTTAGRSTLRSWSESNQDTRTTSWILSRSAVGTCHTAFVLSSNTTRSLSTNSVKVKITESTSSKRGHQTKLVPAFECYGLVVLDTVNNRDGKCNEDGFPPKDQWPNFNAMVTKLQENYVGSLGEKLIAQQHGFDRDFWDGSPIRP